MEAFYNPVSWEVLMQQVQHYARFYAARLSSPKGQWAVQAGFVVAAFVFVGAVTLGLFP